MPCRIHQQDDIAVAASVGPSVRIWCEYRILYDIARIFLYDIPIFWYHIAWHIIISYNIRLRLFPIYWEYSLKTEKGIWF